jgi:hypothetical protein
MPVMRNGDDFVVTSHNGRFVLTLWHADPQKKPEAIPLMPQMAPGSRTPPIGWLAGSDDKFDYYVYLVHNTVPNPHGAPAYLEKEYVVEVFERFPNPVNLDCEGERPVSAFKPLDEAECNQEDSRTEPSPSLPNPREASAGGGVEPPPR